jgi:hypothetical protein
VKWVASGYGGAIRGLKSPASVGVSVFCVSRRTVGPPASAVVVRLQRPLSPKLRDDAFPDVGCRNSSLTAGGFLPDNVGKEACPEQIKKIRHI